MPDLTPDQAQWMWLAVAVLVTAAVIGLDVLVFSRFGMDTSFSRCCGAVWEKHWSVIVSAAFWAGIYFGHCKLYSG